MTPKPPVHVLDLLPEERRRLLALLDGLSPEQWRAATACPGWSVQDVAAHLLADDLGRLSGGRDGHHVAAFTSPPSFAELLAFVDGQNAAWVAACRRLSPRVVVELLAWSGDRVVAYFDSLDPMATGLHVAWAGPDPSPSWLDVAREYTERWLHQEQVREAVGAPGLRERRLFFPVLDTFVHALPRAYREVAAPDGTHVRLVVSGAAGGAWSLVRSGGRWGLYEGVEAPPASEVTLDEDLAWRVFSRGVDGPTARRGTAIEGSEDLGAVALSAVAVMA